jgi:hypothetical protein
MDSRHDSFLEPEDKACPSSMDVPSSPLSSVPEDLDYQQTFEESEVVVPDDTLVDPTIDTQDFVRRSGRKRKMPDRYLENIEDAAVETEVPERPTKQQRVTQPRSVQPQTVQPKAPRKTRGQGRQSLNNNTKLPTAPVEASSSSAEEAIVPSENAEEGVPSSVSNKKSKMVTLRVDPERLGMILQPKITLSAFLGDAPTLVPEAGLASETESTPEAHITVKAPRAHETESTPEAQHISVKAAPASRAEQPDAPDPFLIALSKALTHKVPIAEKPLPRGEPEIWAENRWDLCESLCGLYAAWQGSYYGKDGVAKAFMLDGTSHSRDHLDENVIIMRASGSMERDGDKGMKQAKDQEQKHQYHAMINAINQQSPIAVICGDQNSLVASKMPHKYCSLGWYKATHVWFEKDKFNVIKYRLEKLKANTIGWWLPEESDPIVELGSLAAPIKEQCTCCDRESDQVYLCGWMCLNSKCDEFWTLPDGSAPTAAQLLYDPRYLKQMTPWANEEAPMDFSFPIYNASAIAGEDYKVENLRGLTCPQCGKCNARVKWEGWECTGCGFEHKPKINILPASAVQDQNYPVTTAYAASNDHALPHVKVSLQFSHNYRWITYKLPTSATEEGEVVHGIANTVVREEEFGPNAMWEDLQNDPPALERRKLSNGHMKSFTLNYGMPYKFVAAGQSVSFGLAPWTVTEAVARMNWADRVTSGTSIEDQQKFNELYLVGYLQNQSMNYHDDGESGLGSTVATLSLGCRAEMGFRPKFQHYHGLREITRNHQKMTVMTMDEPLPEYPNYELRKQFIAEINGANLTEQQSLTRRVEMAKELRKTYSKAPKKADDFISLSLGHGDIVIMRGAHLQKCFEHGVEPKGLMRYALTCRTILPGHLKPSEMPNYEVDVEQNTYDGSNIA